MNIKKYMLSLLTFHSVATVASSSTSDSSPVAIIDLALTALGGEDTLGRLSGVTYHAPK